jgi:Zn-dependent M28 family amino/carboxypeptidase
LGLVASRFSTLPLGPTNATLSINVDAAGESPVKLRNVVGMLRGSDKTLRDTYVLVTAHYDHLGVNPNLPGPDKIYNGANDDGSGTVSVIEIAAALSKLKRGPKRSIVFMTVFGEEKGGLGSRYYGRHPIFPIEKTVADVNLEQIGRTDDSEGPQVGTCAMTGFDFSDVGQIFQAAGELVGIKVFKHPTKSDTYFGRSDNQALADLGVPAHTLSVAYDFPDYHKVGDHWDKVDYDNMAKVDRMVALGLVMIANNPIEPKWDEANPKAARYLKAWRDRRKTIH